MNYSFLKCTLVGLGLNISLLVDQKRSFERCIKSLMLSHGLNNIFPVSDYAK